MEKVKLYKLHFTSPVHFADASADYDVSLNTISSDTLYSALIACRAKYGLSVDKDILGCTFSSLFPFYQKDKVSNARLFFPKPLSFSPADVDPTNLKKLKKIEWLEQESFVKMLNGENIIDIDNICGAYFVDNDEIDKDFVYSVENTRVKLPMRNYEKDTEPFYMDKVFFKDYSGLFFLAQGEDFGEMEKSLELLKLEGIGTDRNVGNGFFEFDKTVDTEDFTNGLPFGDCKKSDYIVSLSTLIPKDSNTASNLINGDLVAYDLQRRGGWITAPKYSNLRKNVVYSFTAGSVLANAHDSCGNLGHIVDLTPSAINDDNFHVWRDGRAIVLPIKL